MKTTALLLLVAALAAAQDRSAAAGAKQTAAAESGATLPKGAIEIEPNLYRYTDAQGKTWLARRTPFGFSRWEDKPAPIPAAPAIDSKPQVKATDLGDRVKFETPTPFGATTWTRQKSDLTGDEKEWLAQSQQTGLRTAAPVKSANSAQNATEKR